MTSSAPWSGICPSLAARFRASVTPYTARLIRAPSGSWSSPTPAASAARTLRLREPSPKRSPRSEAGRKVPGFGHPVHKPLDPRAERILELADARGVSGPHVALARAFRDAIAEASGKPLTMNVAMPIAAVMLDLGFSADVVKAVPILARTAGLLAHLAEEKESPLGFYLAGKAEEAVEYEPPDARA